MFAKSRYSFDQYLILFAFFFSVVVVLLGAFCRLADSGLGCPDWPGCYGHLLSVPVTAHDVNIATQNYPTMPPLSAERMWPEMIHRYFAGTLGLLVFLILFRAKDFCKKIARFASSLVIFQAVLGMWTVTWKLLPTVVMGHLLGGFTLTSLLWWILLAYWVSRESVKNKKCYNLAVLMTVVVFLQILLGGWTSSNYAALICPDFPFCHGTMFPNIDLVEGFKFFIPIGLNYEFGLLSEKARIAIQMVHRWGALITALTIFISGIYIFRRSNVAKIRKCIGFIFAVILLQILLGVLNIKMLLPIEIAVAHNGVGLLLMLSCITLCYFCKE